MENQNFKLEKLLLAVEENTSRLAKLQVKVDTIEKNSLTPEQLKQVVDGLSDDQVKAKILDWVINGLKGIIFFSAFVAAGVYLYEFYKGLKL